MISAETIPDSRRFTSLLLRCALALALVAVALALTLLLQNVVSTAGYLFFYIAVVLSAWFGGKWPGSLAVVLAIPAVEYFFITPVHSFKVNRESLPVFLEFAVSSAIVAWFSSWRRQAEAELKAARDDLQTRVEERTAELREANEHLLAEMAERSRAQEAYSQAQAELARMTQLSAMGALAASISHEINQPLAAVVANADASMIWLSGEPPNLEEARAAVDSIAQEGTRASEIVRRIRSMFTRGAPERKAIAVNELIREVATLIQGRASRSDVAIELKLADNLPEVMGDSVQIQQVVMNLMLNGIEAMNAVNDRARRLLIRSESATLNGILVAIQDSGVGIETKDAKRIFDAFFTTKSQGMGMGLSISYSIIESHGGRLWANANTDHGATFQFTLPAQSELVS